MRRIGERAGVADLRNGFRGRDQQQTRVHQPLADVPLVGRHLEMTAELLLERSERTVRQFRKLLDGDVFEDMVVDDLFEILFRGVHVAQQLAFDAAVLVRGDQIDQFGHLDVLGRLVAVEIFVAQVVVGIDEKVADRIPCGHGDVRAVAAVFTRMFVRNVQAVGDVQMHQDTLEVRRRIIKEHLFEGLAVFREVLDIVMPDAEVEYVSACERLALIAFVDVLRTTKNVTDCIARKRLRLDSVVKCFDILHDHRLLSRRIQ